MLRKTWEFEPQANWGTLFTAAGPENEQSEQGRYQDYYEAFAKSVADGTPPPVSAETGARTLAVLDAARQRTYERRRVNL